MKIETIYKTDEGKYRIEVSIRISSWSHEDWFSYDVFTSFIPNGKRKPLSSIDKTDKLPENVVLDAKLKFWNIIKPK